MFNLFHAVTFCDCEGKEALWGCASLVLDYLIQHRNSGDEENFKVTKSLKALAIAQHPNHEMQAFPRRQGFRLLYDPKLGIDNLV